MLADIALLRGRGVLMIAPMPMSNQTCSQFVKLPLHGRDRNAILKERRDNGVEPAR